MLVRRADGVGAVAAAARCTISRPSSSMTAGPGGAPNSTTNSNVRSEPMGCGQFQEAFQPQRGVSPRCLVEAASDSCSLSEGKEDLARPSVQIPALVHKSRTRGKRVISINYAPALECVVRDDVAFDGRQAAREGAELWR